MEENVETFSSRLNKAMKEKHITPGMMAIKTGISDRQIRYYQKGEAYPGSYSLKQLASALGVSTDWLLGIESEEEKK